MSETIKFNETEEIGEYKVPEERNANWRDDVPEEKEAEEKEMFRFQIIGGDEKGEREYISPKNISPEAERRMLLRAKRMKIGKKVLSLD